MCCPASIYCGKPRLQTRCGERRASRARAPAHARLCASNPGTRGRGALTKKYFDQIDQARQSAVNELIGIIRQHYPAASFMVGPGEDDPAVTHITTTVDTDDPDEIVDLVIDRMLELQLDQGIPVYVIPIRTPERVGALRRRQKHPMAQPSTVLLSTSTP